MDRPSIFGSAVKTSSASAPSDRKRRTEPTKSATSSSENTLSSDSIGLAWTTVEKAPEGAAPTERVGESPRIRLGKSASISALRRRSASYSASEIVGASSP